MSRIRGYIKSLWSNSETDDSIYEEVTKNLNGEICPCQCIVNRRALSSYDKRLLDKHIELIQSL
jgi:hypothetical protein